MPRPLPTLTAAACAAVIACTAIVPGALAGAAKDADGRLVAVETPDRIISLGGPVSEIIAGLGRADSVIAVDSTTRYPATLDDLPRVGYLRNLGAEGLLSEAPRAVIAQNDAGPPRVLEQVEAAGVPVLRLPAADSLEGLKTAIRRIAALLEAEDAGTEMIRALHQDIATLPGHPAEDAPEVLFLLVGHGGAPMAPGHGTALHALFELAGLRNAFGAVEGWKPVSAEALAGAAPDGLIVSRQAVDKAGGVKAILSHPALARVSALKDAKVVPLDPTLLQGLGPRTPKAARTLAEAFGTLAAGSVEEARR